jgi:arylformamidase
MPEKGPPVFLDYDQATLDAAYDQAAYAPNREQLIKRRISDSKMARLCVGEPERVAYGPAEIERLDIYRTRRATAPAFVFIHSGAWRSGSSKDFATPAEMFLAAGAHYVVPDFAWVQDVGGSLMVLADQVRRVRECCVFRHRPGPALFRWSILGWAPRRGCANDGLAARVRPAGKYRQRRHVHQRDVRSDAGAAVGAQQLSQVRRCDRRGAEPDTALDRLHAPVIVAYGTCETPEFQRQNREFVAAVKAAGKPVRLLVGENYNHFELPESLGKPYGLLGRGALDLLGLKPRGAQ